MQMHFFPQGHSCILQEEGKINTASDSLSLQRQWVGGKLYVIRAPGKKFGLENINIQCVRKA